MSPCHLFQAIDSLGWLSRCQGDGSFWLPPPVSSHAGVVDDLFQFLLWISTFFFLLIVVLMAVFVVVYRRRPQAAPAASPSHNTLLEIVWTGIPLAIVVILFYRGFTGYLELRNAPEGRGKSASPASNGSGSSSTRTATSIANSTSPSMSRCC